LSPQKQTCIWFIFVSSETDLQLVLLIVFVVFNESIWDWCWSFSCYRIDLCHSLK
jgi:hypothetical protein